MRFSQRIGKTSIKTKIQIESMDDELRISLWNMFTIFIAESIGENFLINTKYEYLIKFIWSDFFKRPLDTMPEWFPSILNKVRKWFFECNWYEVYDFIEFIANVESPLKKALFIEACNNVLEEEVSGYRFISGKIGQITDNNEIRGIEEAIDETDNNILNGANVHLRTALNMLTDRKKPDYRNSIKESISAVETISKIISGESNAGLGKALKLIDNKIGIHPALKNGFLKIYGYTSDEDGIRHAILQEKNITFEDAKYMLVSCSAFVFYLIMKVNRAGLKIS